MERKDRMVEKTGRQSFFIAFFSTLCILVLVLGTLTVDYHGRRMSLADDSPVISVVQDEEGIATLRINIFGRQLNFNITVFYSIWKAFCEFCCLPHRTASFLVMSAGS